MSDNEASERPPAAPAEAADASRAPLPGDPWALLDGAEPPLPLAVETFGERRRRAADRALHLAERLEAFEDIFDSQVGDTSLTRARSIEREFGLRQLFLKFEGGNPTGTQKDRIAFAQVKDALRRGFDGITVATCGNYGAALALAASIAGLRCVVYIPRRYQTRRVSEMERLDAKIVREGDDYEIAIELSRAHAEREELYDANPGGANTPLQLEAYGEIAREIYDELGDAPAVVAVPVSNGTTLAGIYKGFLSLYRRGKTSRMPRLVAGSSQRKNPIVESFLRNHERCEDLDPSRVRETRINEPLINWRSTEGDAALAAIRHSGGWAGAASDRDLQRHARWLREAEGLSVLPASTAGLVVLLDRHRRDPLPPDRYVVVLTGRR